MDKVAEPSSLKLITNVGEVFVVERSVATKLKYIKNMMDTMDVTSESEIPMGHIDSRTLEAIFSFVTYSITMEDSKNDTEVINWKRDFLKMDDSSLFKIIEATNYLDIPELYELACERVAKIMKELKTSEAIRSRFNIRKDNP